MATVAASEKETNKSEPKRYAMLLQRVLELQRNSRKRIYERVKILAEVYHDREWRDAASRGRATPMDDYELARELNRYVDDMTVGFDFRRREGPFKLLLTVYEYFPMPAEWRKMTLSRMVSIVTADSRPIDPPPRNTSKERSAVATELARIERTEATAEQAATIHVAPRPVHHAAILWPPADAGERQQTQDFPPANETLQVSQPQLLTVEQALRNRVAELEAENAALRAKVAELEATLGRK